MGITLEDADRKMTKNFMKAVLEHTKRERSAAESVYATLEELTQVVPPDAPPLRFGVKVFEHQNPTARSSMEDASFHLELPEGLLVGVFDGHGGSVVANHTASLVQRLFQEKLAACGGNVFLALETTCEETNQDVIAHSRRDGVMAGAGCTAVITFIDKVKRIAYTATVGDSETHIYRTREDGKVKSIPCSTVRDWSDPKEAARVAIAVKDPTIVAEWPKVTKNLSAPFSSKDLRYPPGIGVNVSRSFGDYYDTKYANPHAFAIIHKPKITKSTPLQPGDIVVVACDGLEDFLSERIKVQIITEAAADPTANIADRLGRIALTVSTDNITVVAVTIA